MSTLILLAIFFGLMGIVVMIIYLIDRVNSIDKRTAKTNNQEPEDRRSLPIDRRFSGLDGEKLWNQLASQSLATGENDELTKQRQLYCPVLIRHIQEVFEEGTLDARQGLKIQPASDRSIKTTNGQIVSWIPSGESRSIYELGQDRGGADKARLIEIAETIDRICTGIFTTLGISQNQTISNLILPGIHSERGSETNINTNTSPPARMPDNAENNSTT